MPKIFVSDKIDEASAKYADAPLFYMINILSAQVQRPLHPACGN